MGKSTAMNDHVRSAPCTKRDQRTLARRPLLVAVSFRPGYSSAGCSPAEPASASPAVILISTFNAVVNPLCPRPPPSTAIAAAAPRREHATKLTKILANHRPSTHDPAIQDPLGLRDAAGSPGRAR